MNQNETSANKLGEYCKTFPFLIVFIWVAWITFTNKYKLSKFLFLDAFICYSLSHKALRKQWT